jgi:uncharacterized protein (DUF983 family)
MITVRDVRAREENTVAFNGPESSAVEPGGKPVTRPTTGQLVWRALARRCPLCAREPMFEGWFSLRSRCGQCGFAFERDEEEDYWLGAFLLNFIVTEVIFAVLLLAVLIATWPNPPWSPLMWIGAVQMIVAPIVFYPFSKALWLAGDLIVRPPTAEDFATRRQDDERV